MLIKTGKRKQISRGDGCYRSEKTKSTGSVWPILGSLLGLFIFILFNFFLSKDVLAAESKSLNICHFFSYVHGEDQSKPKKYLAGFSKLLPRVVLRA